ncbi:hypothetical protein L2E82_13865 [Cichorium intybus]|uniref:Uncharacterized protein n=1 Tax=Cichorium intybus TaxID=13427 RepID=A0ACB9EYF3_CICIN|nr:hypothetical protein L2E82_13865 [Cichorium intybus]
MAIVHQNEEEKEAEFQKTNNMAIVPTTLATIESLTFPLVQEVVLLADFQCKRCQDRVADILSRLNGEAESVEFSLSEKKVTLTLNRRHSRTAKMPEKEIQNNAIYKNPANKLSLVKRMFSSSTS